MFEAIIEVFALIYSWIIGLIWGTEDPSVDPSVDDSSSRVATADGRLTSYARRVLDRIKGSASRLRDRAIGARDLRTIDTSRVGDGPEWDGLRVALKDTVSKSARALDDTRVVVKEPQGPTRTFRPPEEVLAVLRAFYSGVKLSTSIAGTVVSFGSGGDTIPNVIFLAVDSAILSAELATMMAGDIPSMQSLYRIEWAGVDHVEREARSIISGIKCRDEFRSICDSYRRIIGWIASEFGSLLSTLIPDDSGVTCFVIEMVVAVAAAMRYETLAYSGVKMIYRALPPAVKSILEDPARMREFFEALTALATSLIPNNSDSLMDVARKNATRYAVGAVFNVAAITSLLVPPVAALMVPANAVLLWSNVLLSSRTLGQKAVDYVDQNVRPHIDDLVKLCQKIMALMFTALCLLESCNDDCSDDADAPSTDAPSTDANASSSIIDSA